MLTRITTTILCLLTFMMIAVCLKAQNPQIDSFTPVRGGPGTLITINGSFGGFPVTVNVGGVPALLLSNNGLKIVSMVMPGAASGNISVSTAGQTANADGFVLAPIPGYMMQQGPALAPLPSEPPSDFGRSTAISADGNMLVIGGPTYNNNVGGAWVYSRSGGAWSKQAMLIGDGHIGSTNQGYSVAISADGNTIVTGGPGDNGSIASAEGAIWIFKRAGGDWQAGQKITLDNLSQQNAQFGFSVAVSADGNTVVAGSPHYNNRQGAAWVLTRSQMGWSEPVKLVGTGIEPGPGGTIVQGFAVAISADGSTIFSGGTADRANRGSVWVFRKNRIGEWSQSGNKIFCTGFQPDSFGYSIASNADGNTVIIGAPTAVQASGGRGEAWIFANKNGTGWLPQGSALPFATGTDSQLGISVAINAAGTLATAGVPIYNLGRGTVCVAALNNGEWLQYGYRLLSSGTPGIDNMGESMALSADGSTLVACSMSGEGAAYVFLRPKPIIDSFVPASATDGSLIAIKGAYMDSLVSLKIGNIPAAVISNTGSTLTAMLMPGTGFGPVSLVTTTGSASSTGAFFRPLPIYPINSPQGSSLSGNDKFGQAREGVAVAVSADGNLAVSGAPGDSDSSGCLWIYQRVNGNWQQLGTKISSGIPKAAMGMTVAMSADGNTVIAGSSLAGEGNGAVWIFRRSGYSWLQSQYLPGVAGRFVSFGSSLAISASGNTIVVGASRSVAATDGAVVIFSRTPTGWVQQGEEWSFKDGSVMFFGKSVAISADGNTVLAGGNIFNSGAAWLIRRTVTGWKLQAADRLTAATSQQFGSSLSLSGDGNTALIGDWGDNNSMGSAWVFRYYNQSWSAGLKLVGTGNVGLTPQQGYAVSLTVDGRMAAIGGLSDGHGKGAVWVFTLVSSMQWQQVAKLVGTGIDFTAWFGQSVALSSDGSTLITGGSINNVYKGSIWSFVYGQQ